MGLLVFERVIGLREQLKASELRTFASERSGLRKWLLEECHDRVGDLAETISLSLIGNGVEKYKCSLNEWLTIY